MAEPTTEEQLEQLDREDEQEGFGGYLQGDTVEEISRSVRALLEGLETQRKERDN